jgi:AraC-like DNA-binding protein
LKKVYYLYFLILFFTINEALCQDTVFIKSFNIPSVRNIDLLGSKMIIRYKNSYQIYQDGKFDPIINLPKNIKAYTWVNNLSTNNTIFHTNFFPEEKKVTDKTKYKNLIPGDFSENLSVVTIKNLLYIVWKGKLLEYKINNHYQCFFKDQSIRHIFCDGDKTIISSYNGIYSVDKKINTLKKYSNISYSNGELCKIPSGDFLCFDGLMMYYNDSMIPYWSRHGQNNFRKIVHFENKDYALFEHSISQIDIINKKEQIIKNCHNLSDIVIHNNCIYFSSENGDLFTLKKGKVKQKLKLNVAIYNIVWHQGKLLLSCDDGLHIFNNKFKETTFIPLFKAVKTIPTEYGIFTSTYEGLYLINLKKNKVYNVIEEVEFNRKALTLYDNYLYAGSIQGLFVINLIEFNTNFIETLSSYEINQKDKSSTINYYFIGILILLLIIVFILLIYLRKSKKEIKKVAKRDVFENENAIYELIANKPSIKSVEDLALELDVSIPTLITKIKKLTGLSVLDYLKQCKKKIALDLYEKNISIEEIAKRVGYSTRFVKTNFLKN